MDQPLHDLFIDYTSMTLKDLILGVLMHEARLLRQIEIQQLLKKHYPKKHIQSSGAMSLSIGQLVRSRAILQKDPEFKYGIINKWKYYYVNPELIKHRTTLYASVGEKLSKCLEVQGKKLDSTMLRDALNKCSSELRFGSLAKADKCIQEMLLYLAKYEHLLDPKIVC